MTTPYELGVETAKSTSWLSRRERRDLLTAAGHDVTGGRVAAEFIVGFRAELARQAAARAAAELDLAHSGRLVFIATAEHGSGRGVGHPCTTGVYSDPTDQFQVTVEAATVADAEREACRLLAADVDSAEPCKCRRAKSPGGNAWWDSVSIMLWPRTVAALAALAAGADNTPAEWLNRVGNSYDYIPELVVATATAAEVPA